MTFGRRVTTLALVLALTLGVDRASKLWAIATLQGLPRQSFLGDLFRLEYAENRGSFLSLGAGLGDEARFWLLVVVLGLVLGGMLLFALFARLRQKALIGLAFIIGGGLGNWIDRLLYDNVVVDFMNVGLGGLRSGVFNIADLFLEVGIGFIIWDQLRGERNSASQRAEDAEAEGSGEGD
ncbi:MAG: signal peptidase II [Chloroflexota bacterium]